MTVTAPQPEKVEPVVGQLPAGWVIAQLNSLAIAINPGFASGEHNASGEGIPHLRPMNINRQGQLDLTVIKSIAPREYEPLKKGDIFFNNTNSPVLVGKTTVIKNDTNYAFSNHMTRIRLTESSMPEYIALYFHSLFTSGYFKFHCMNHVNQASIGKNFLEREVSIPLPPLAEQRRIVTKIEELFSKLDAGVLELKRTRALLKRYRQSVLHAAVTGELSRRWREAQGDELEDARHLLAHILDERRSRWTASGKKGKYAEPQGPDVAGLPELPQGWVWATVEQLIVSIRTGTGDVPVDDKTVFPVLRSSSVRQGNIDFSNVRYLKSANLIDSISAGNLLFTRLNGSLDFVGNCALVRASNLLHYYPDRIFCAVPSNNRIGEYIETFFGSSIARDYIRRVAKSTAGHQRISTAAITEQPIPFPSLPEQSYIVTEVERRLSILANVEDTVEAELKRAESTRQGILRRAFAGQLVPQDAADEPASVLLERIQAERLAAGAAAVRAGGKRGRKPKTAPQVVLVGPGDA